MTTYVTPFGQTGPYRDYSASDLVLWHMGGLGYETPAFSVTDLTRHFPLRARGYQAEYLAAWTAAAATMVALFYRERYGVGQMVDVGAMEAVANHIRGDFATYSYDISRLPEGRMKSSFPWIWPCKDGHISFSTFYDHWWEALKEVAGRPEWMDNPDYVHVPGRRNDMDTIEKRLTPWVLARTRAELYDALQSKGVPCFPVLSTREVVDAPNFVARRFFVEQDHPVAGRIRQPGAPVRLRGTPWSLRTPAPTLGQHNDEELRELRVSAVPAESGDVSCEADSSGVSSEGAQDRPLAGIRVLDFGWILSVPHCGAWLGTMGAEVVRVESEARLESGRQATMVGADGVQGVNRSANWNGLNYSKLDVTLNLREPSAIELVKELVAVSDVVMENFSTGVMERLGLGYEALRRIRPDLVMLSGSTLGVTGPERQATGFGPNVSSYAGLPFVSGYPGGPPVNMGGNWPDYLVSVIMVFSILSALRYRQKTGRGQYIEVSMAEVIASAIPEAFLEYAMNGREMERIGNHDPHMAPHNVYPCQGHDQWVAVAVGADQWRTACEAMRHPEWVEDPRFDTLDRRKQNEEELDRMVSEWTEQRTAQDITRVLQRAGIAAGPVMSIFDLMDDPHLKARGFVIEMDHPEVGRRTVAGLPAKFSNIPELAYAPAPLLGQHNELIFGELLALGRERVQRLVADRVLY